MTRSLASLILVGCLIVLAAIGLVLISPPEMLRSPAENCRRHGGIPDNGYSGMICLKPDAVIRR